MNAVAALPLSAQELCEAMRLSRILDLRRLDRVLRVERSLVEVQAQVTWGKLAEKLQCGQARFQSFHVTVGESVASNAAGLDGRPAVAHIEALALVTPDGHLRRVNRISNPTLFALTVGGQGLFGALYSVTLRLDSLAAAMADARPAEVLLKTEGSALAHTLQLLVPPPTLAVFLDDMRERCADWRIAVASLEVRRIRPDAETYLRWAARDYVEVTLGLHAKHTLGAGVRLKQLCSELIDSAIARDGAFPIGSTRQATREQTLACYPQLGEFLAEHRRIDPQEKMANRWLRHQRRLLSQAACEVRWGT